MRVGRSSSRFVPNDYAEAVEKWARAHGGHARLKWLPDPMNCWAVILTYRVGDPRQATDSDGEPVLLHDWKPAAWWKKYHPDRARRNRFGAVMGGNYAYELDELGAEGIVQRLDRGNILSGRGEFASSEDAMAKTQAENERIRERRRLSAQDDSRHMARDQRRSLYKIPFLPVGIELKR